MSATPSRWPRDSSSQSPAITEFLPTMPLELDELPAPPLPRRRARAGEIWHDTQPQGGWDDEDTQPGGLDPAPPLRTASSGRAALPTRSPAAAPLHAAPAVATAAARPAVPAPAPAVALLDPADPLAGRFDEPVSGLEVRELDNDELFQRLFGAGR